MTSRCAVIALAVVALICLPAPLQLRAEWKATYPGAEKLAPYVVQVEQRSAGSVTVHIQLRRFQVTPRGGESRFEDVSVPGWGSTRTPGMPELPMVSVPLLLQSAGSIVEVRKVERSFQPVWVGPFSSRPKRCSSATWRPTCDTAFYESSQSWPETLVELRQEGFVRRAPTATLVVRPFRFAPDSKLLHVTYDIEVDIDAPLFERGPDAFESSSFDQFRRASFFSRADPSRDGATAEGLLVVAHDSLLAPMEEFVDWKASIGFEVTLVPLSEVGDGYQALQSYIASAYSDWNRAPTYVLLVGDGEGAGKVPFVPSSYGCASDFLYSTLDGDDLHSDLFVGRMSVHTPEEAQLMVSKALWYEANIEAPGDSSWLSGAICISSSEGQGGSNDDVRSDIICDLQSENGYAPVDRLYHSLGNDTAANISAKLNEGRGYVTYLGHGSGYSWSTTSPAFSNMHVKALENAFKLPFVVDVSCSNGEFDSSAGDCFAEAWTKTGTVEEPRAAVGIYSASTPAAWDEPAEMAVGMAHGLLEQGVQNWGALAAAGRAYMLQLMPFGSSEETCHQYVVFGDPSLSLRTGKAVPLEVTHPDVIPLGGVDVEFIVQAQGAPVTGATVVLEQSDAYSVMGKTDVEGHLTLFVDAPVPGEILLTAFAADSLLYQSTLETLVPGCGIVQVSPAAPNCSSLLTVTLFDSDLNTDPDSPELTTLVAATSAGTVQDVFMTESEPDSGKFTGQLQLSGQPGQFKLEVSHADTVTVSYADESCDAEPLTVEGQVVVDCEAPEISEVKVDQIGALGATITFLTSEKSVGGVSFGTDGPGEEEKTSGASSVAHEIGLDGLTPDTGYLFSVSAADLAGNAMVNDNDGAFYQFTTLACVSSCGGKSCGSDGCGGTCGQCCDSQVCENGVCIGGPGCEASGSPGCGGCACEECTCDLDPYCCQVQWDDLCVDECVDQCGGCGAQPDCDGKECGPDGCGGICGECTGSWTCTDDYLCVENCQEKCEGKECGSDGCGGQCGECEEGETCESGACLAPCGGYSFEGCCVYDVLHYCDEDFEMEVDCSGLGLTCGWKESTGWYDCVEEQLPSGKPDLPLWCPGTCPPQCDGKECGPDGCGSVCGNCEADSVCENGMCVPDCIPQCDERECGDDGCEGSCGDCGMGELCDEGKCESACAPACNNKECGPDGCGSVCGACAPGMVCSAQFVCEVEQYEDDVVTVEAVEEEPQSGGSGSCSAGPVSQSPAVMLLLMLIGLLAVRRRCC